MKNDENFNLECTHCSKYGTQRPRHIPKHKHALNMNQKNLVAQKVWYLRLNDYAFFRPKS